MQIVSNAKVNLTLVDDDDKKSGGAVTKLEYVC